MANYSFLEKVTVKQYVTDITIKHDDTSFPLKIS